MVRTTPYITMEITALVANTEILRACIRAGMAMDIMEWILAPGSLPPDTFFHLVSKLKATRTIQLRRLSGTINRLPRTALRPSRLPLTLSRARP